MTAKKLLAEMGREEAESGEDFPPLENLTKEELAKIAKPENVVFVDWWKDDGEICVGVIISGVKCSFWWLGFSSAAAFVYPDSPTAMAAISDVIKNSVETAIENQDDEDGEFYDR